MDPAIALLIGSAAGLLVALEPYRTTQHGPNPWSFDGALNVLRLSPYFARLEQLMPGHTTSVYRSSAINAVVGGAQDSDHLYGCAVDRVPLGDVDKAAQLVLDAASRGELGPVRQVVREPTWVHVGWYRPGKSGPVHYVRLA